MRITKKINNDLEGLALIEKLDYWFSKIYPEQLDDGREEVGTAERFFETTKLIETDLGYIPIDIFDNHFAYCNKDQVYVEYIAERAAKEYFLRQKPSLTDSFELHGKGYVDKILKESEKQLGIILRRNTTGDGGQDLHDKIYYKKYLIPFCKHQLAKYRSPEFINIEEAVSEEDKAFILRTLEYLKLTKNGKSILATRQKSELRGAVEAFRERGILPNRSIDNLIKIIAEEIKMPLNARLKNTGLCKAMKARTINYIKYHH